MNEIIKLIEDAVYRVPTDANYDLHSYLSGATASRKQVLDIIRKYHQENCDHVYGSSDGKCLNCSISA